MAGRAAGGAGAAEAPMSAGKVKPYSAVKVRRAKAEEGPPYYSREATSLWRYIDGGGDIVWVAVKQKRFGHGSREDAHTLGAVGGLSFVKDSIILTGQQAGRVVKNKVPKEATHLAHDLNLYCLEAEHVRIVYPEDSFPYVILHCPGEKFTMIMPVFPGVDLGYLTRRPSHASSTFEEAYNRWNTWPAEEALADQQVYNRISMGIDVLTRVVAAHAKNIVMLDLKRENVMVAEENGYGTLRMIDVSCGISTLNVIPRCVFERSRRTGGKLSDEILKKEYALVLDSHALYLLMMELLGKRFYTAAPTGRLTSGVKLIHLAFNERALKGSYLSLKCQGHLQEYIRHIERFSMHNVILYDSPNSEAPDFKDILKTLDALRKKFVSKPILAASNLISRVSINGQYVDIEARYQDMCLLKTWLTETFNGVDTVRGARSPVCVTLLKHCDAVLTHPNDAGYVRLARLFNDVRAAMATIDRNNSPSCMARLFCCGVLRTEVVDAFVTAANTGMGFTSEAFKTVIKQHQTKSPVTDSRDSSAESRRPLLSGAYGPRRPPPAYTTQSVGGRPANVTELSPLFRVKKGGR